MSPGIRKRRTGCRIPARRRCQAPRRSRPELVSTLQVLLQARRLHVASTLWEAKTLVRELLDFKVKVSLTENDALASWREGLRDDLVFAIAIAGWMGERMRPSQPVAGGQRPNFEPYVERRGLLGRLA